MGDPNSLAFGFALKVTCLVLSDSQLIMARKSRDVDADVSYVCKRASAEGLSVFTTLLPRLGRSLDASLATGSKFSVEGFALYGKLPKFMGDLFRQIFDDTGRLHPEPSVKAVRLVRQVAYLFYKLELEYSKDVLQSKYEDFIRLDSMLPEVDNTLSMLSYRTQRTIDGARILFSRLFDMGSKSHTGCVFDPSDIVPKHGPGAVAGGETYDQKYHWSTFYHKLDREYAYADYMYLSYTHLADRLWPFGNLKEAEAGYARLCAVPKDSRGPRLISMEPLEYQWIQQGLGQALVNWVEKHPLTRGYVNFTDQQINRDLALYSSLVPSYDTLDMKDASDRVSCWLVKALFPPRIWRKLDACRTVGTDVPLESGMYRMEARKFAPMGSALCFPVEALVFWALSVATLYPDVPYRSSRIIPHEKQVYVYGDDLIVPKGGLEQLEPVFHELFLEFNKTKCCTDNYFRESCGMDAFSGESVTPIRIKHWGSSPTALVSTVETANAFSILGFDKTAAYLYGSVESQTGALPWDASGRLPLSKHCPHEELAEELNLRTFKSRFNRDLQRLEIRVLQPVTPTIRRGWPGWEELFRKFGNRLRSHLPLKWGSNASRDCALALSSEKVDREVPEDSIRGRLLSLLGPTENLLSPCEFSVHRVLQLERKWISIHMLGR